MKLLNNLKTIINAVIIIAILLTIGLASTAKASDDSSDDSGGSSGCGPPPMQYDDKGNRFTSDCSSKHTYDKDGNEIEYDDKGNAVIIQQGAIKPIKTPTAGIEEVQKPGENEVAPYVDDSADIKGGDIEGDESQQGNPGGGGGSGGGGGC